MSDHSLFHEATISMSALSAFPCLTLTCWTNTFSNPTGFVPATRWCSGNCKRKYSASSWPTRKLTVIYKHTDVSSLESIQLRNHTDKGKHTSDFICGFTMVTLGSDNYAWRVTVMYCVQNIECWTLWNILQTDVSHRSWCWSKQSWMWTLVLHSSSWPETRLQMHAYLAPCLLV